MRDAEPTADAPARTAREILAALTGAGSQAGDRVELELPRNLSASQRRERIDRWCAVLAELWADGHEIVASLRTVDGEDEGAGSRRFALAMQHGPLSRGPFEAVSDPAPGENFGVAPA